MSQIEKAISDDEDNPLRVYPRFPIPEDRDIVSHFRLQLGDTDLFDNYQPVLDLCFELMCEMKVPHRSKGFEQRLVRTMFFRDILIETIDGKSYEITKETKVHVYNCAEKLQYIIDHCKDENIDFNCS